MPPGPKSFATRGHLLVCQNSNCKARGSDLLYRALWNVLERDKLAYYKSGGSLRLTESGCLGACGFGPVMVCYRTRNGAMEEAWYAAVNVLLAREVAQAMHDETELPALQRYGP
ncbi:NAD(P)H-dependent oxidoreductase subunit E [Deinococcus rubellus]|uniref:(2Fe-2S) ferredoxin domain-containing protein n=1 Tax=Deinococcus rubellus TaxID=1889240 RepID=A0ABY5YHN4_9DEIO|nr:(2Fe-2S) ferredoxin domain-containing protein [Deinococcus rubellus]UWX63789.1 (2Fe-2S) ferredoxin domain-containing protein [Deinococcus rubellus]